MRQLLSYVLMFTFNDWRKKSARCINSLPAQTNPHIFSMIAGQWHLINNDTPCVIAKKKYPLKLPFPHMFPSPTWLPARDRLTEVEAVASHMCPNFTRRWRFEFLDFFCICVKVYLIIDWFHKDGKNVKWLWLGKLGVERPFVLTANGSPGICDKE